MLRWRAVFRSILLLASMIATAEAVAARLAIHPAFPSAADEVFIVSYGLDCSLSALVTQQPIDGGRRIRIPFPLATSPSNFSFASPCWRSIGVPGAGRHEIVAVDAATGLPAKGMSTTIVEIPSGAATIVVDQWTYEPSTMDQLPLSDGQIGAVVRLSGNLFAAVVRQIDGDAVSLFGLGAGDWRRLTLGLPSNASIGRLVSDARDQLYVEASGRAPPTRALNGSPMNVASSIWKIEPSTGVAARYADAPPGGALAAAFSDGRLLAVATTVATPTSNASTRLLVFTPGSGWKPLNPMATPIALAVAHDSLYAILPPTSSVTPRPIVRLSLDTGQPLETISPGNIGDPVALQSDQSGLLLVVTRAFTPNSQLTLTPPYTLYRGDPRDLASFIPLADALPAYPFAAGADGSHLSTNTFGTLRFRKRDGTTVDLGAAGLGPRAICTDSLVVLSSSVFYNPCSSPRLLDQTSPGMQRASVGSTQYIVSSSTSPLALKRVTASGEATTIVDLIPAILGSEPLPAQYGFIAYRLASYPDNSGRMLLLVKQYAFGLSVSPALIAIDVFKGTAMSVPVPAVVPSDIVVSPTGIVYLTTRFGEILRRAPDTDTWTEYGHLSSAHLDLHPAVDIVDATERVLVYGANGTARAQGQGARAVELFHPGLGHYFMTANGDEADALSRSDTSGWKLTGSSFPVISGLPWTARSLYTPQPVCRFYGSMDPGPNSHFYTAVSTECAGLRALATTTPASQPRWNYEGIAFTAINASARIGCNPSEQAVYRFFNGGSARGLVPNHRYIVTAAQKASMSAAGWILEDSAWCIPNDGLTRIYAR